MPRQSDPGSDPNNITSAASAPVCAILQIGKCAELNSHSGIGAIGTLERLRGALLERIDIVRLDLKAHAYQSDDTLAEIRRE